MFVHSFPQFKNSGVSNVTIKSQAQKQTKIPKVDFLRSQHFHWGPYCHRFFVDTCSLTYMVWRKVCRL